MHFFKTFLGDIIEVRKDTPFGRSLPVKAVIGSNPPPPFLGALAFAETVFKFQAEWSGSFIIMFSDMKKKPV